MKLSATQEGGLRIEIEDAEDRELLESIGRDAESSAAGLAKSLGGLVNAEEIAEDWEEYVTPDLHAAFLADVEFINRVIAQSEEAVFISRDDSMRWYSALNQARLGLEELHPISEEEDGPVISDPAAWLRSRFYCALQTILLDEIMTP